MADKELLKKIEKLSVGYEEIQERKTNDLVLNQKYKIRKIEYKIKDLHINLLQCFAEDFIYILPRYLTHVLRKYDFDTRLVTGKQSTFSFFIFCLT